MAKERPRTLKVLDALSELTEPTSPADVGRMIGVSPRDTGKTLYDLGKAGLAEKPDEKQSLWLITDKGRKYRENPPVFSERPLGPTLEPKLEPTTQTDDVVVPNQADVLRYYGEKLHIGVGRGGKQEGTPLDAIIFFVQQTADLNDLNSVWNALTKMAVPSDVKKRWIELYAKSIPGKEIPEELKEKLEGGLEAEKVKLETGEISPKPKRFSIVGGEIIGDPEGDYSFKEALQYIAQQRGASPDEAGSIAIELSKMGPEMLTTILSAMTPLISKEPEAKVSTITEVVSAAKSLKDMAGEGKELPEWMRDPVAFQKTIQELTPKGDTEALKELKEELTKLREDQHQAELKRRDEQNASLVTLIQEYRGENVKLRDEIEKNKMATGRTAYDLLGDLVEKVPSREDVKAMVMEAVGKGPKLLTRGIGERAETLEGMAANIEQAAKLKSFADWWFKLG